MTKFVSIGKEKRKKNNKIIRPENRFRVYLRQIKGSKDITCNSFMVYDFTNRLTPDGLKKKLMKSLKNPEK